MKKVTLVKLVLLLIIGIEALLMHWRIIPPGIVNETIFCLSLVALIFLFVSTSFSGEQKKIRKKLFIVSCMIILWYTIVPYVFSKKVDIPINEGLWAAVIFGIFAVLLLMLGIKDLADIDRQGNNRWAKFTKKEYAYTVLAAVSFTTAMIFCIYTYLCDFSPSIMMSYSVLGIIATRRL